ncbi:MAG: enoyl-CoA hydratase-related protein [Patulibacter sp.]
MPDSEQPESTAIAWAQDGDGIVTLTLDAPGRRANTMDGVFAASLAAVLDRLETEQASIAGVIVTSAKPSFLAGGDLKLLRAVRPEDAAPLAAAMTHLKTLLRRLECLPYPVVAALGGSALGGGLELALATHHRVAVDDPQIKLGLPEVQLGLLPGAGGVTRTVRMLGIADALMKVLLKGDRLTPAQALEIGLVDELVASAQELEPAARAWIAANPAPSQPWDRDGYRMPGGTPASKGMERLLPALPANLRKQLGGANYPAPKAILAAAVEGAQVDFDGALVIEGRYLTEVATGQVAKNMIQAFFFDLQEVAAERGSAPKVQLGGGLEALSADDRELLLARVGGEPGDQSAVARFAIRALAAFLRERLAMLREGVAAPSIEQATLQAGYPLPRVQWAAELTAQWLERQPPDAAQSGAAIAPEPGVAPELPLEDLKERLLFIEAIEAVRCLDDGLLDSVAAANVDAIIELGFPAWTGGVLQYIDGYEAPVTAIAAGARATASDAGLAHRGPAGFVARAQALAQRYGERFSPPASLVQRAERGERYGGVLDR